MSTCFNELGQELCYVAECKINASIKILDLTKPYEAHGEYADILNALVFSSLMSKKISTSGYDKPAYIFSRFIADCVKSSEFDAIKYPSTKLTEHNYNLAILNKDTYKKEVEYKKIYFFDGKSHFELRK